MKRNIGTKDRMARLSLAIILFLIAFLKGSWIALIAGGFVFFEALFSWCIVYHFLGRSTCPRK